MSIKIGNIDVSSFKVGSADCRVYLGDTCVYSGDTPTPHDYSQDYFTFRVIEDIDIRWSGIELSYSTDGGTTWSEPSNDISLSAVTSGSTVMFKGNGGATPIGKFDTSSTGKFEVEGNIMSLLYGDNFVNQTDLTGYEDTFADMFTLSKTFKTYNLISAENLVLPATTLDGDCYRGMFQGCAALVTPPKILPATTLTKSRYGCYNSMFRNCTSLTTVPGLPATTLSYGCYSNMFQGCTSLTTAPVLSATTLVSNCYGQMFYGCTSLVTAPELLATTLADSCYQLMFRDCTSLTTAPSVLPATTLAERCYYGMFNNCTSLTAAPELPATTLAKGCYQSMFESCTSLTTAPELLATTLAQGCYRSMFSSCTNLSSITCLATSISADKCTQNWLNGVSASGTFTKAASMTSWTTDVNGIPSGWTVVDYSS